MKDTDRKRMEDNESAEMERDKLKAEITTARGTIREKEKNEEELKETILCLEADIIDRDKKIETDVKYYEKILKEINALREKVKR